MLRHESTTGLVFSAFSPAAPLQVAQCHTQVTVLWCTLTSCCLTSVVHRAGLHEDTSTSEQSRWAVPTFQTPISTLRLNAWEFSSFCTKEFGWTEESHPAWIHALQDTAAEKLNDLSSPGAGATAFEQKSQLQFLWTHSEQVFHHHLCFCGKLTYTSPGWRFEGRAGWVEQKLLNGMRTIMNGKSRDKKMHSECL